MTEIKPEHICSQVSKIIGLQEQLIKSQREAKGALESYEGQKRNTLAFLDDLEDLRLDYNRVVKERDEARAEIERLKEFEGLVKRIHEADLGCFQDIGDCHEEGCIYCQAKYIIGNFTK